MLLDGYDRQEFISNRLPMPVDILADTAYLNSITGETLQLYYFSDALLTCATAGESTASNWTALTSTSTFQISLNGNDYVIAPDFTGDVSMANVAASIQVAIRLKVATATCTWSTDHFIITTVKDETGDEHGNSVSVLTNPDSNSGTDIAGSSWMNGKYGAGVITAATLTTDAGEAAGTIVVGRLAYTGILDQLGCMVGNHTDTSLAWTTGTVLPMKYLRRCNYEAIETSRNADLVSIAYEMVQDFANGEWCIDHRNGVVYGKKATTGTSDTVAYKVLTQVTGGGTSVSTTVKITDGTDVLDVLVQDAAYGTASKGLAVFGKYMATPATYTTGDATVIATDINGNLKTTASTDIPSTLTGGEKVVTTGGTAEALGNSLATKSIYIRAKSGNTNDVYIGDSTVDKTTNQQIILSANDSITLDIANRTTVYVDATTDGEGVDYLAMS